MAVLGKLTHVIIYTVTAKKYMSPAHPMTISWVTFTVVWFNSFLLISIIIYFISKIELYGTITRRELK